MTAPDAVPVTVVGAGPYGLATAAHLRARGIGVRVLGEPMESWISRMPVGMYLKSTPSASSISDPSGRYGLDGFRAAEGRVCGGDLHPVAIEEFVRYGLWFQKERVPDLERSVVREIDGRDGGFRFALESGETFTSRSVVIATGLGPYASIPRDLVGPAQAGLVSHPAEHTDLSRFAGRRVAVVGAGQSALESAALLHEAGALPTVVARTPELLFGDPPATDLPAERPLAVRLVKPASTLGPGWSHVAFSRAAAGYRYLPERTRAHYLRTVLGPSGAWWLRDRVEGRFPVLTGHSLRSAEPVADGLRLGLANRNGDTQTLEVDHVLAATGYRVNIDRLDLLSPALRAAVNRTGGAPRLSAGFESSVPGLYFTGLSAAATFGPVLRFVAGTAFAAGRVGAALSARG